VVDHPLRPTKDRRLGKLLTYQQPNLMQIYLSAEITFRKYSVFKFNQVNFCPELKGKILRILTRSLRKNFSVQLACVKHTTSVHPEPGSNS